MNFTEIKGGFLVPEDSHLGKWQIETQRLDHDDFIRERLSPILKPNMNVLDGGAFNGDHSIFYSEQVNPGIVVAVEAGEATYEALKHNVTLFFGRNVFPVRAALWSTESCSLEHFESENLGASCVRQAEAITDLETTTIDKMAHLFNVKFDFIKLDLEGCELQALIGGIGVIQKQRPILVLEINSGALASKGSSFEAIENFLSEWEYEWELLQSNVTINDDQFDILCHPK